MRPSRYRTAVALATLGAAACAAGPALADVSFADPIEHAVGAQAELWAAVPSVAGAERGTLAVTTPTELVLLHADGTGAVVASERAALPAGEGHAASLADLDADGTPEAFVASAGASALAVYRRQGAALQRAPDIPTGDGPGTPSVADLNADGHLDMVILVQGPNPLSGTSQAVRLMGDGTGGFGAPQPIVGSSALQVVRLVDHELRDLDGDGDPDLLVTGQVPVPSGDVFPTSALLNDGTGAFGQPKALASGPGIPRSGEVTGDAHIDLVRPGIKTLPGSFGKPSSDPFAARVLPGDGAGGVGQPIDVGSTETSLVTVAQLDGVGPEDIVIRARPEFGAPAAGVFAVPSLGGGTFGASIPLPPIPFDSFVFADVNGDGATDLAVGDGEAVSVRLNEAVLAGALDFGEVPSGTGVERPFDVRNDGAAPLALGTGSIAGPAGGDFTLVEDGCSGKLLLAGQACTVRVHFRPGGTGLRTAQLQFVSAPEPRRFALSGVGLAVPGPAAGTPRCGTPPAAPQPGQRGAVRLTAGQLRINQRIGQAAIRRLNAVDGWLEAGVQGRDLCGGTIGAAKLGGGISTATALAALAEPSAPSPRPVTVAAARGGQAGVVRLSAAQLRVNQRIYQAAIRRADALEARLAGKLTGGDLAPGALTQDKLAARLRVLAATPPASEPARSRTEIAPRQAGQGGEVVLTAAQLRINQRIAQAAVRRSNALLARLRAGLPGEAFADGSITARNLASGVVRP